MSPSRPGVVERPAKFATLSARAEPLVLAGRHQRDAPPREGGRWPITVVLAPGPGLAARLDEVTAETLVVAGAEHWPTGSRELSHVTVTALEGYRAEVAAGDRRVAAYQRALARAAARCGPVTLRFEGLTLTPSSIMACAVPADGAAEHFRGALAEELAEQLGPTGWSEWDVARDIWYANLVHFAGDIPDPAALVDWVARRRDLDLGTFPLTRARLWRYTFDERRPRRPVTLADEVLRG